MKDALVGSNVDLGNQAFLSPPKAVKILKASTAALDTTDDPQSQPAQP